MSNITSYKKNGVIYYQVESSAAYVSGASGASGTSGPSGITVTVEKLSVVQLSSLIKDGKLSMEEVEKWCKGNHVPYEIVEKTKLYNIAFTYGKTNYSFNYNKDSKELQSTGANDNLTERITSYTNTGIKIRYVDLMYDKNGTELGKNVTNYSLSTGETDKIQIYSKTDKYNVVTEYEKNADGTVTMYTYKDGKAYFGCTFNEGEFAIEESIDSSKTKKGEFKEVTKDNGASYVDEFDSNGKKVLRRYYDANGGLMKIDHYMYDNSGKLVQTQYTTYKTDGSYTSCIWKNSTTTEVVEFNSNCKKTREAVYSLDKDGNKTGCVQTLYDTSTGKVQSEVVYSCDKANNKNIPQEEYVHNADGTITMYKYADNGRAYVGYKTKDGEFTINNPIDESKTKTIDWIENGVKKGTIKQEYDTDGNPIRNRWYKSDGSLDKIDTIRYDKDGNRIPGSQYTYFNADGSYTSGIWDGSKTTEYMIYNPNNQILSNTIVSYDENDNKIAETRTSYDKDGKDAGTTQTLFDPETGKVKKDTDDSKLEVSAEDTIAETKKSIQVKEGYTLVESPQYRFVEYSDGTIDIYLYDDKGNEYFAANVNKDDCVLPGACAQREEVNCYTNSKKSGKDEIFSDENGEEIIRKYYDQNGNLKWISIQFEDKNGNTQYQSVTVKNASNKSNVDHGDAKVVNDQTGTHQTQVRRVTNSDGTYTEFTYDPITETVVRRDYDKNGKTASGEDKMTRIVTTGSGMKTYNAYAYYKAFANGGKISGGVGVYTAMKLYMDAEPTYAYSFLQAARVNNNPPTQPAGCNGKTYHVSDEGEYADYLTKVLANSVGKQYGYDPEDVIGYHFDKDSSISKIMATNPDLKQYVQDHLQEFKNGEKVKASPTFNLKNNKDLYYSIHGTDGLLDYEISEDGKKLTLKFIDVYDFEYSHIDEVGLYNNFGTSFDGIGAALMKDGQFKPYYQVYTVEVTI